MAAPLFFALRGLHDQPLLCRQNEESERNHENVGSHGAGDDRLGLRMFFAQQRKLDELAGVRGYSSKQERDGAQASL